MNIEKREIDLLPEHFRLLSDVELEAASGGLRYIDIHMPYGDFIKWPGGDASPGRYA